MKFKLLATLLVTFSCCASAQTVTQWQTGEYYRSRTLDPIRAATAYSRGYTGKDSTIAILDTGIDLNSTEFKNRIILTRDFTNSNSVQDTFGHGSHVAGIAAAARDGLGMHGVAFDANLMIARTSVGSLVSFNNIVSGLDWAASNGATVANISANIAISSTIKPTLVAPGIYTTTLTNTGKYASGQDPFVFANAMKNDIVVVVAAGNNGTPYPSAPGQFATAVDSKGNLLLGGRMIIAGNWNAQLGTKVGEGNNGAGTLCNVAVAGVCQDKYKTSDFYLMAPGMGIYSVVPKTVNSSGYTNMSGTSMAAPAIAGGVAVIRQMWPQMTGENIVKLLMVTGNKNLPGYTVALMGQGLMDLDAATKPVGVVGIPTTGRLDVLSTATPILITGGSASTAKLSSFMVADSFERDFYASGKYLTAVAPAAPVNAKQVSLNYLSKNGYSQFNNYSVRNQSKVGNVEVNLYRENLYSNGTGMIEVAYNKRTEYADFKFIVGSLSESNTWLGNSMVGAADANNSVTYLTGLGLGKEFGSGTSLNGNVMHGMTYTKTGSSLVKSIDNIMSYSWNVNLEQKINNRHAFGVMVYQPVSVYNAQAKVDIPTGLDANFNVVSASTINLAATVKEMRTGVYYKLTDKNATNALAFAEARMNYQGQSGVNKTVFGIALSHNF